MKTALIRIGNSRGVRIPKAILEECGLQDEVDLEVREDHLVIRAAAKPRTNWEEAFRRMGERGDDALLDENTLPPTKWETTEWEW